MHGNNVIFLFHVTLIEINASTWSIENMTGIIVNNFSISVQKQK